MGDKRWGLLAVVVLLGGVLAFRPAGGQGKADVPEVGRYKLQDMQVGKFIYRFLFDSYTADYWLWVNGEWEAPEPPKEGSPWKDIKPTPGRFQLLPQIPGDLDSEIYVFDTATGKVWSRPARNRIDVTNSAPWREIQPPARPKR
jgi:hypothetical protein